MRYFLLAVLVITLGILLTANTNTFKEQPPVSAPKQIKLLFAGDIMVHQPQIESAYDEETSTHYFGPSFEYITPLISQADLAIANLELTTPKQAPYTGWPNFKCPEAIVSALANTGFDLLTTANNHSNDAKQEGLLNTIETIQKNGLYHTGTYRDSSARALKSPLIVYKNGFKLAFLNYTYGTDKKPDYPPTVVNKIDTTLIKSDINEAKSMHPDAIITLIHWGKEYHLNPSPYQEALAQKILNWGSHIIIGSHPHVVQPIHLYQSENQEDRKLVAYSLGNFISNQQQHLTNVGLVLEIELTKQDEKTILNDYYYSTVYRHIDEHKNGERDFYTIPTSPYQTPFYQIPGFSTEEKNKMVQVTSAINNHLSSTSTCKKRQYHTTGEKGITSLFY